jgi:hypothetical protein
MFAGYQKDAWRLARGTNDVDFMQTTIQIYADKMAQWERNGAEDDPPTMDEAIADTRAYYMVGAGQKFVDSFAMNRQAPGQFLRDRWQETQQQYPGDQDKARAYFMEQYGDWAKWYTFSSSNYSAYLPATEKAYNRVFVDYPDLARRLVRDNGGETDPEFVAMLALGTDGTFSSSVYNYYRDNPLPGDDVPVARKMDPDMFESSLLVDQGWQTYSENKAVYDANAQRLRELRDNAQTEQMKSMYRTQLDNLNMGWGEWKDGYAQSNRAWGMARNEGASNRAAQAALTLQTILEDKKFMADAGDEPVWQAVKGFMAQREVAMAAVVQIPSVGYKNPDGSSRWTQDDARKAIRESFVEYVNDTIIPNYPEFSPVWDRYFAKEWGVE